MHLFRCMPQLHFQGRIVCPSPKVWYFDEKRLHWASVVRVVASTLWDAILFLFWVASPSFFLVSLTRCSSLLPTKLPLHSNTTVSTMVHFEKILSIDKLDKIQRLHIWWGRIYVWILFDLEHELQTPNEGIFLRNLKTDIKTIMFC